MDIRPTPAPTYPSLSYDEAARIAKKWGIAHGYYGRAGGWVYNSFGHPIVQGWYGFWLHRRRRICDDLHLWPNL